MKRICFCLMLVLAVAVVSFAANREAERAYNEGRKLEQTGKPVEAFEAYRRAAELEPRETRFAIARERARQNAAFHYASNAVRLVEEKRHDEAIRALEQAEKIDPSNDFIKLELARSREALAAQATEPSGDSEGVILREAQPLVRLRPKPVLRSWNLRGDARTLYLAVSADYGIHFNFDDSVPPAGSSKVAFRIDNADFSDAMAALQAITGTMVAPLEAQEAVVAKDTVQNRALYERVVLTELSVEGLSTPEEINEVAQALRGILGENLRSIQPNLRRKLITVRGTVPLVETAQRIVDSLVGGRPQVLIELETLEVFKDWSRDLGVNLPLGTSGVKVSPVNHSVQSGAPVPLPQLFGMAVPLTGVAAAMPLALFGGGQSLFGISLPGATLQATLRQSLMHGISSVTVRAGDSQPATFTVGQRYPIINASFSPVTISSAIQQQQQAGTLINPFPSFTFEDLGIKVKVTPRIHDDQEVTLKVEAQVRALTGQTFNGMPSISNRETEQVVRVRDGQPTLITGIVESSERRTMSGTPYLAQVPVLKYLFGVESAATSDSEIIMILTPHIVKQPPTARRAFYTPSNYVPVAPQGK